MVLGCFGAEDARCFSVKHSKRSAVTVLKLYGAKALQRDGAMAPMVALASQSEQIRTTLVAASQDPQIEREFASWWS